MRRFRHLLAVALLAPVAALAAGCEEANRQLF